MTITLTHEQEQRITDLVASGLAATPQEVIDHALRALPAGRSRDGGAKPPIEEPVPRSLLQGSRSYGGSGFQPQPICGPAR